MSQSVDLDAVLLDATEAALAAQEPIVAAVLLDAAPVDLIAEQLLVPDSDDTADGPYALACTVPNWASTHMANVERIGRLARQYSTDAAAHHGLQLTNVMFSERPTNGRRDKVSQDVLEALSVL